MDVDDGGWTLFFSYHFKPTGPNIELNAESDQWPEDPLISNKHKLLDLKETGL